MRWWQHWTGTSGMIAVLLLPNLLIFGVFVLIPLGLNFAYSLTGGTEILLAERPYVGGEHYTRLLDCEDYVRPITCREDQFWTAARNTGRLRRSSRSRSWSACRSSPR
jgi:alpha-1,4-digalacturonate transport system permease protein